MNISTINNVYLIGIGGIGMSALARYFKTIGKNVAGYDKFSTALTDALVSEGIDIHFDDNIEKVSSVFLSKQDTLVIFTPAVPKDHAELNYFLTNGFELKKRSEILGMITREKKSICVSGTHGKTTISTMIAHILKQSKVDCNAFLGGISKNYGTNLLLSAHSDFVVAEADEFDRSFLRLFPDIATISSIDADHLDIYGDRAQIVEAFEQFTALIKPGGVLFVKAGLDLNLQNKSNYEVFTYSLNKPADYFAENIELKKGVYHFDIVTPTGKIRDLALGVPGLINVENAVVAVAVAAYCGVTEHELQMALPLFLGAQRRLDLHIHNDNQVYIDDYAHHPKELEACISSIRKMYPDQKITGVFQPHLFTRTRDFADEFAESLSLLDELILLDIYPARELPIEGVTSSIIFDKVTISEKLLCTKDDVLKILENRKIEVLLTMGAGNIDQLVKPIKALLGGE
jgi:UDP-N-acetylmuramate--alanine ligase